MQRKKELLELSTSIKRNILLPTVSALPETIPTGEICILESNNRGEEVEVVDHHQNTVELPIKSVALNCEFAVSNSSCTASTIPINIMASTVINEKCSAAFEAPSTTVNVSVYADLRCQHNAHASVQSVVRQPAILLVHGFLLIRRFSTRLFSTRSFSTRFLLVSTRNSTRSKVSS